MMTVPGRPKYVLPYCFIEDWYSQFLEIMPRIPQLYYLISIWAPFDDDDANTPAACDRLFKLNFLNQFCLDSIWWLGKRCCALVICDQSWTSIITPNYLPSILKLMILTHTHTFRYFHNCSIAFSTAQLFLFNFPGKIERKFIVRVNN